jgi:hypothetical protein
MSSFVRRLQRQVVFSQVQFRGYDAADKPVFTSSPPRQKYFGGRGKMLGVKNPKCRALLARLAREAKQVAA